MTKTIRKLICEPILASSRMSSMCSVGFKLESEGVKWSRCFYHRLLNWAAMMRRGVLFTWWRPQMSRPTRGSPADISRTGNVSPLAFIQRGEVSAPGRACHLPRRCLKQCFCGFLTCFALPFSCPVIWRLKPTTRQKKNAASLSLNVAPLSVC